MTPCHCGESATVEKQGKSLCAQCAKNYAGREFPIRSGKDISLNDYEKTILKYHHSYSALTRLLYR